MNKNRLILQFTEEALKRNIVDSRCRLYFRFGVPSFQWTSVISQEDHLNENFLDAELNEIYSNRIS